MFVKSVMIPKNKCITVNQDDTIEMALNKLESHQIDGIPVLNDEKFVGTLTRYDLYENFFFSEQAKEEYMKNTLVKDVAGHVEKILNGNEVFEKTLLDLKDFPLLAVVDEYMNFLGAVTRFDVLEQFQSAFGTKRSGVRIAFTSVESEGRLARLADIARHFHEQIISLVTFDETDKLIRRMVMKIEKKDNIQKFIEKLETSGFRILDVTED
ncbi:CBS domain-containing protein [Bacillus sp. 03113]|uniref:CBS domain-containing protein n=1 Tax=Bacillus sp. 03113 TaxID=2578211 RepID=UPI001141617F|nr:CBS domain-containing protein [Bacillus sp. 03113]